MSADGEQRLQWLGLRHCTKCGEPCVPYRYGTICSACYAIRQHGERGSRYQSTRDVRGLQRAVSELVAELELQNSSKEEPEE